MKVVLKDGAKMPQKAHRTDGGFDLFSRETAVVKAHNSHVFDTGVAMELPAGTVGLIKSKSGLNIKHGIQSEGVDDVGYTGNIYVKLYNHSDVDYEVKAGDKITQLVIVPIFDVGNEDLELVDSLEETERGDGAMGSSGR